MIYALLPNIIAGPILVFYGLDSIPADRQSGAAMFLDLGVVIVGLVLTVWGLIKFLRWWNGDAKPDNNDQQENDNLDS